MDQETGGCVDVAIEAEGWQALDLAQLAQNSAAAALTHLGYDPDQAEISLLGCDDARIAALNADFRGKPTPTNVLSWPSAERAAETPGGTPARAVADFPGEPIELGDIAIAIETCQREAADANKTAADHVTHLLVHGTLHLLGYDHECDEDAALMERLETEILADLGVKDPY